MNAGAMVGYRVGDRHPAFGASGALMRKRAKAELVRTAGTGDASPTTTRDPRVPLPCSTAGRHTCRRD